MSCNFFRRLLIITSQIEQHQRTTQGTAVNLYDDLKSKVAAARVPMKTVCERAGVSSGTPSHWAAVPPRTTPNQRTYDKMIKALQAIVAERDKDMKEAGVY